MPGANCKGKHNSTWVTAAPKKTADMPTVPPRCNSPRQPYHKASGFSLNPEPFKTASQGTYQSAQECASHADTPVCLRSTVQLPQG